jgi:DNA mismatch repair ATPase MutL
MSNTITSLAALKRKFSAAVPESPTVAQKKPQKQPRLDSFFCLGSSGGGGDTSQMPPCIGEIVKSEHEYKVDSLSGDADGVSYECSSVETAELYYNLNDPDDTNPEDISNKENSSPSVALSQQDRSSGDPTRTQVRGRLETSLPTSAYRASEARSPVIIFDDFASVREKNYEKVSCASGGAGQLIDSGRARIVFDDFPPVSRSKKSLEKEIFQDENGQKSETTEKPTELLEESFPSLTKEAVLETLKVTLIEGNKPKKAAKRKSVNLAVSMSRLRECVAALKITNSVPVGDDELLRFKARISPEENSSAEAELDRQLSKSDFASMSIYGQFNLGFLIVGHRRDLFIVDQHATDEKYNFETLQRTTVIGSQRMVAAQRLELTSVGEAVVMDNLAVFQRNGFQFQAVFRIHRIHMFLSLMDPDPDPLVRGMDPDPDRIWIRIHRIHMFLGLMDRIRILLSLSKSSKKKTLISTVL